MKSKLQNICDWSPMRGSTRFSFNAKSTSQTTACGEKIPIKFAAIDILS